MQPRREQKELERQLRQCNEPDWLAERGSAEEARLLREWATHKPLNDSEREAIFRWLKNPSDNRLELWWDTAKKSILGRHAFDRAMERHKELNNDRLWIVACLTARGLSDKQIGKVLGRSRRTVVTATAELKDWLVKYYGYEFKQLNSVRIAKWFLGV